MNEHKVLKETQSTLEIAFFVLNNFVLLETEDERAHTANRLAGLAILLEATASMIELFIENEQLKQGG